MFKVFGPDETYTVLRLSVNSLFEKKLLFSKVYGPPKLKE